MSHTYYNKKGTIILIKCLQTGYNNTDDPLFTAID